MRRVRPPRLLDDVSETLVDNGPFQSKQKLMMFAAALGFQLGDRTPFTSSGVDIRWDIFERNSDDTFVYALAIIEDGTLDILNSSSNQGDHLKIFEEYAHTGIKYIKENVVNSPEPPLDEIVRLTASFSESESSNDDPLASLSGSELDALGL
jgi:dnd system-associated protein 4